MIKSLLVRFALATRHFRYLNVARLCFVLYCHSKWDQSGHFYPVCGWLDVDNNVVNFQLLMLAE